jgi:hypothetical protein
VAKRRPARPVPPMAGTAAIGAVVQLLVTALDESRGLSLMSSVPTGTAYRLLDWRRGQPAAICLVELPAICHVPAPPPCGGRTYLPKPKLLQTVSRPSDGYLG